MLVKIRRLMIENNGYKRDIYCKNMYVNSSNIISITDYDGAQNFLLLENSELSNADFSLLRINQGSKVEEVIAIGTADHIFSTISDVSAKGNILNG
jgi:ferritin